MVCFEAPFLNYSKESTRNLTFGLTYEPGTSRIRSSTVTFSVPELPLIYPGIMLHLESNVTARIFQELVRKVSADNVTGAVVCGDAVLELRSNPTQSTVGHKFTKISKHR
jgi:hypothetical protein